MMPGTVGRKRDDVIRMERSYSDIPIQSIRGRCARRSSGVDAPQAGSIKRFQHIDSETFQDIYRSNIGT